MRVYEKIFSMPIEQRRFEERYVHSVNSTVALLSVETKRE
jgi:hypothetical protein